MDYKASVTATALLSTIDLNYTLPEQTSNFTGDNTGDEQFLSMTLSAIYGVICLLGLLGNGLVIFVVLRYAKMKTVTNMYILNLAIADSYFLVGLPMVITTMLLRRWIFGYMLCKVFYILTCVSFTSFFTVSNKTFMADGNASELRKMPKMYEQYHKLT